MAIDYQQVLAVTATVVTAAVGGGWLTESVRQRGNYKTRHADELERVRGELRQEIQELRRTIHDQDARIDVLTRQLQGVQLSYAVFREKVRMLIHLVKTGDTNWKTIANDIEDDRHEVDDMFRAMWEQLERNGGSRGGEG